MAPHADEASTTHSAFDAAMEKKGEDEYTRLHKQHDLFKIATGGNFVQVPLPKDQPICIIDSATNDGVWLVEVGEQYPNATLVGADNNPAHFTQIKKLPPNLSFKTQSIFDPWPAEDKEAYDLVHQRCILALFSPAQGQAAIEGLYSLVKPGGYIQIIEGDLLSFDGGADRPGMAALMDFCEKAFPKAGMNNTAGRYLKDWLETAGATEVESKIISYEMGAAAKTKDMKEATTDHIMDMIDNIEKVAAMIPNYWFTPDDFRKLKEAVFEDMQKVGNTWRYHLATGKKPA